MKASKQNEKERRERGGVKKEKNEIKNDVYERKIGKKEKRVDERTQTDKQTARQIAKQADCRTLRRMGRQGSSQRTGGQVDSD